MHNTIIHNVDITPLLPSENPSDKEIEDYRQIILDVVTQQQKDPSPDPCLRLIDPTRRNEFFVKMMVVGVQLARNDGMLHLDNQRSHFETIRDEAYNFIMPQFQAGYLAYMDDLINQYGDELHKMLIGAMSDHDRSRFLITSRTVFDKHFPTIDQNQATYDMAFSDCPVCSNTRTGSLLPNPIPTDGSRCPGCGTARDPSRGLL